MYWYFSSNLEDVIRVVEGIRWLHQCCKSDPSSCDFCIAGEMRRFISLPDVLIKIIRNNTLFIEPGTLFNTIPKKLGMIRLDMLYFDNHMVISLDHIRGNNFHDINFCELLSANGISFPHEPLAKVYFGNVGNNSTMSIVTPGVISRCVGKFTKNENSQKYSWSSDLGLQEPINVNIGNWPDDDDKTGPRKVEIVHEKVGKISNVRAKWNNELQTHVLKFKNDRVKERSEKNCRFDYTEDENTTSIDKCENTVLQFGKKYSDDHFILDVSWPFSIIDAVTLGIMQFAYPE
jgi:hypothetical protein